jgi:hypothetical protein
MELVEKHTGLQQALVDFGLNSFLSNAQAPWIL